MGVSSVWTHQISDFWYRCATNGNPAICKRIWVISLDEEVEYSEAILFPTSNSHTNTQHQVSTSSAQTILTTSREGLVAVPGATLLGRDPQHPQHVRRIVYLCMVSTRGIWGVDVQYLNWWELNQTLEMPIFLIFWLYFSSIFLL